jgi:uncharacterized membrane protein YraQ (UPF0718 family)
MRQTPVVNAQSGPDTIIAPENRRSFGPLLLKLILATAIWIAIYHFLVPVTFWITYGAFGFSENSRLGSAIYFFIFEAPKVLMLLVAVVFIVGIIRSFFTPERTRRILAGKREFVGNIMASGLGIVTPFCSCSAVPLFIGFVETGVPWFFSWACLESGWRPFTFPPAW